MKRFASWRRRLSWRTIFFFTALVFFAALLIGVTASTADTTDANQPASQGRVITPAGALLLDANTRQPATGALPVKFVRSPDTDGPNSAGRYLLAVNSGFGLQFNAATNRAQQSLAVIDLNLTPQPAVIQNVYFPSPQSVNVGVAFAPQPSPDKTYALYVSGGFENKIWIFRFQPNARLPISPASSGPNTTIAAPSIDLSALAATPASPNYNDNHPPVYPTGLAINSDGDALYVANNLDDSLGIITNLRGASSPTLARVDLHRANREQFIYPYDVVALSSSTTNTTKIYVSCWNDASVAVIDPRRPNALAASIAVARHPTAMLTNKTRTRLYVVNSNADAVSVIDTNLDREIERINVRLAEESPLLGNSPESAALSADEATLYVANAHSNSVAVVTLSDSARDVVNAKRRAAVERKDEKDERAERDAATRGKSIVRGFIPTGQYPSALAVADGVIYCGNGKGTGVENSSLVVNNSGRVPNAPNDRFPAAMGRNGAGQGGQYSVSLVVGNISRIAAPDERTLANYTQQVMRNNNLLGAPRAALFKGASPIKHVVYVIRENRTYDQVFGDVAHAGNGQSADGDALLAIFGAGEAARRYNGPPQNITPNAHALALRFGLLDRFFVNAEASPDGHNWSTAAFSNDYIDKAYRWDYSGRGRTYDYEGFNRLPSFEAGGGAPSMFSSATDAAGVVKYLRRFVPYLHGARDVGEPDSLYLWDLAARAGLSYRNYGEFIATVTADEVAALNSNRKKTYPDLSPTVETLPTKKSLENHHSTTFRNFDLYTPDAITTDSYKASVESKGAVEPLINARHDDARFRGNSRLGEWVDEFRGYVNDLTAGRGDRFPQLSIMRLSNDHTAGLSPGLPTPQFSVADNDYAVGRLVETISNSPYWKDTAIFVLEDDAQNGPDHIDAHRSPALVISAYNRPGALVHEFHNTVSLIRTIELLLGLAPMNQLDATAIPIDIFRREADLRLYRTLMPEVALDNLINPEPERTRDRAARIWIERSLKQDLVHADMADARVLNEIIWYSVRGANEPMPDVARLPVFDAMRLGLAERAEEEEEAREHDKSVALARRDDD